MLHRPINSNYNFGKINYKTRAKSTDLNPYYKIGTNTKSQNVAKKST